MESAAQLIRSIRQTSFESPELLSVQQAWSAIDHNKGGACSFPDCPRDRGARGGVMGKSQSTSAAGEPPSRRELPPCESRVVAGPPLGVHSCGKRGCPRSRHFPGSPSRRTPVPHRPPVICRATTSWKYGPNAVVRGASGYTAYRPATKEPLLQTNPLVNRQQKRGRRRGSTGRVALRTWEGKL